MTGISAAASSAASASAAAAGAGSGAGSAAGAAGSAGAAGGAAGAGAAGAGAAAGGAGSAAGAAGAAGSAGAAGGAAVFAFVFAPLHHAGACAHATKSRRLSPPILPFSIFLYSTWDFPGFSDMSFRSAIFFVRVSISAVSMILAGPVSGDDSSLSSPS